MSEPEEEKTLSVLHEENQRMATASSKKRKSRNWSLIKWTAIVVLIVAGIWTFNSPYSAVRSNPGGMFAAPAPAPVIVPLSDDEQKKVLAKVAQDGEVLKAQQTAQAEADAQAAEAARLVYETTQNLPTSIKVAKCNPDEKKEEGWSKAVEIPDGWMIKKGWGGKHVKTQVLQDGIWQTLTTLYVTGEIAAVRYCTTSQANLDLRKGIMDLSWEAPL